MAEKNVVIAVGGTGNKIMEAMVYGAAAGVFYTHQNGEDIPVRNIDMLSVDVDALCGNTTRAMQVCEAYDKVFECLDPYKHKGFSSRMKLWQMDFSMGSREKSVSGQVINNRGDRPLADALFNEKESQLEYAEGFRGHPDLGVMFFSEVVSNLKLKMLSPNYQPDQNGLTALMAQMERALKTGYVNIILVGSIFGGTGASGIPILSRFLRENLKSDRLRIAAVLMLPYYSVPPKNSGDILDLEIVIDSSEFMDKAKTALGYYGAQRMLRTRSDDKDGVYDALYLMGLPTEAFITMRRYATGTGDQENDSHLMEWLAVRATAHFFRFGTSNSPSVCAQQGKCYAYQMQSGSFSWRSFDFEEIRYRQSYGGLVKAGVVYLTECYPYIRSMIDDPTRGERNEVNYYASHFLRSDKLSQSARATLVEQLDAIADLFRFMLRWMIQVMRSLPPSMRVLLENENAPLMARNTYINEYLPTAAAWRRKKKDGGKSEIPVTQSAYKAAQRAMRKAMSRLSLAQQYRVLERVRRDETAAHTETVQRLNAVNEELDALRNEPDTPEISNQIAELEHRAELVQSAQRLASFRMEVVSGDQKLLLQRFDGRGPQQDGEGDEALLIPENDLMDAGLMYQLGMLLDRLTNSDAENESNGCAQDIQYLLSHINGFIRQNMRDRVTITRIYEALGRGTPHKKNTNADILTDEQALEQGVSVPVREHAKRESGLLDAEKAPRSAAAFLVRLMNVVTEEAARA